MTMDADLSIGTFVGPVSNKVTGERKKCDVCKDSPAMWMHFLKTDKKKKVYLCFGCGDH